jgi:hypothetical protein
MNTFLKYQIFFIFFNNLIQYSNGNSSPLYTFLPPFDISFIEDDLTRIRNNEYGTLTGDVQNWATIIQNYILQLASDQMNRELTQELFDLANYTVETKVVENVVEDVKNALSNYFVKKQDAAHVSFCLKVWFFLFKCF